MCNRDSWAFISSYYFEFNVNNWVASIWIIHISQPELCNVHGEYASFMGNYQHMASVQNMVWLGPHKLLIKKKITWCISSFLGPCLAYDCLRFGCQLSWMHSFWLWRPFRSVISIFLTISKINKNTFCL